MKNRIKKSPHIAGAIDAKFTNGATSKRKRLLTKGKTAAQKYLKSFDSFNDNIDSALAILKGEEPEETLPKSKRAFYKQKIKEWAKRIKK